MTPSDIPLFLSNWLRDPLQVGAVLPSGPQLAQAMARQVEPRSAGAVLELGAGTGVVTRALLDRGIPRDQLLIVERDPNFCTLLRRRFPGAHVLHADARHLRAVLAAQGVERLGAVVSSLPLLSLPFTTQRTILRQCSQMLGSGTLIQFTYGVFSPVHPILQRRLGLTGRPVARVLFNLPPAVVWRYRSYRANPFTPETLAA